MTSFLFNLPWNLLPCFCLLYMLMHSSHCVENIFFPSLKLQRGYVDWKSLH